MLLYFSRFIGLPSWVLDLDLETHQAKSLKCNLPLKGQYSYSQTSAAQHAQLKQKPLMAPGRSRYLPLRVDADFCLSQAGYWPAILLVLLHQAEKQCKANP